jgi:hypothetical protein
VPVAVVAVVMLLEVLEVLVAVVKEDYLPVVVVLQTEPLILVEAVGVVTLLLRQMEALV